MGSEGADEIMRRILLEKQSNTLHETKKSKSGTRALLHSREATRERRRRKEIVQTNLRSRIREAWCFAKKEKTKTLLLHNCLGWLYAEKTVDCFPGESV